MGLPADGRVIAFGDFDGDQLYVLLRCSAQYTHYTSQVRCSCIKHGPTDIISSLLGPRCVLSLWTLYGV